MVREEGASSFHDVYCMTSSSRPRPTPSHLTSRARHQTGSEPLSRWHNRQPGINISHIPTVVKAVAYAVSLHGANRTNHWKSHNVQIGAQPTCTEGSPYRRKSRLHGLWPSTVVCVVNASVLTTEMCAETNIESGRKMSDCLVVVGACHKTTQPLKTWHLVFSHRTEMS